MSVQKIITLTDKGFGSGPYYLVSCSNDCFSYTPCVSTSSVYLPTVGSTALIDVFDTTQCISLIDFNGVCNNSIVLNFPASGSTTTTTTTTSTTTTTTTTTTLAPCCEEYLIGRCATAAGCSVTYLACSGSVTVKNIGYNTSGGRICVQEGTAVTQSGFFDSLTLSRICSGCTNCISCSQYSVFNTGCAGSAISFVYVDCDTNTEITESLNPGQTKVRCSSIYPIDKSFGCAAITNQGYCGVNCNVTTTTTSTTTTAAPTTSTTTFGSNYCFYKTSGLDVYPVTAGNDSTNAVLTNWLGYTIYVYGVFNSGGNNSGTNSADSITVNGSTVLTFNNTITGFGQTFYSQQYYALPNGQSITVDISKQDNLTSGASLRIGYSTTIGGAVTNIVEQNQSNCPATTTTTSTTTTTTAAPKILDWSYTQNGGASGQMDIYVNSTNVESRNSNSSGTWPLNVGDTIYFEVTCTGCSGGNGTANAYTIVPGVPSYAILADAACTTNIPSATLTTGTYTVQSSDTTISVDAFSLCSNGCV